MSGSARLFRLKHPQRQVNPKWFTRSVALVDRCTAGFHNRFEILALAARVENPTVRHYTVTDNVIVVVYDRRLQGQSLQGHLEQQSIQIPTERPLDPCESIADDHAFDVDAR